MDRLAGRPLAWPDQVRGVGTYVYIYVSSTATARNVSYFDSIACVRFDYCPILASGESA